MKFLPILLNFFVPISIAFGLSAVAETIVVRHPEGSVHGFLALRSIDGRLIAAGDLSQTIHGNQLISRLIYRFKDGSVDDETAVFTQTGHFHLVSDHRIQRGPSFPKSTDVFIRTATGEVVVRYTENGENKVDTSKMELPDDLANGLILDVVKNLSAQETEAHVSYLAAVPKPRIVHLVFTQDGTESFRSAGVTNRALRYKIKVDLGGLMGVIAPMVGKEPADSYVWVSTGEVPAFLRSETPLYLGGPQFVTELISPVWERTKGAIDPRH